MRRITLYTDGGCRNNGDTESSYGGFAGLITLGDHNPVMSLFGGAFNTTNNRMELTAVIVTLKEAIKLCRNLECYTEVAHTTFLDRVPRVSIYTDSQYVVKGITEWIYGWRAKGWKTAGKKPVLNRDLWEQLYEFEERYPINWFWVRGHDGDICNEMVDSLATEAMDALDMDKTYFGEVGYKILTNPVSYATL